VKVKEPQPREWPQLREGQILFTYLHLAPDPEQAKGLMESGCTAIAYETVTDAKGHLPLLAPMSEVAGRLSIEAAGAALKRSAGGRGILLGGVPGVAPARVVVIGGGVVGTHAARMAVGLGAEVTVLDRSIARLRERAHAQGIRLAGGEMITGPEEAAGMCASSLYDVLMPDVKYAGGYRGMSAIAKVCDAHGVAFSPHNPTGPIAHLASIHVCAASPTVLWLEHQWAESPLFDALVGGQAAPLVEGAFVVPSARGLGAALDLAVARAHPYVSLPRDANLDERLG